VEVDRPAPSLIARLVAIARLAARAAAGTLFLSWLWAAVGANPSAAGNQLRRSVAANAAISPGMICENLVIASIGWVHSDGKAS
jgi:hypothetical protein